MKLKLFGVIQWICFKQYLSKRDELGNIIYMYLHVQSGLG